MSNNETSKTLALQNTGSIFGDLTEIVIDSFLKEGIAKDIPIVSTIFNLYKSGENIRDHLFEKKLYTMLGNIEPLSEE